MGVNPYGQSDRKKNVFFTTALSFSFKKNSIFFSSQKKYSPIFFSNFCFSNFFFVKIFFLIFFLKLKKNLKRYFYDGAHCQLMEINVRLWSSQSGNVVQSQLMELKVS